MFSLQSLSLHHTNIRVPTLYTHEHTHTHNPTPTQYNSHSPTYTHTHTASTNLQYCSILQCHHEEVEPSHHTPTHGCNVTARHSQQLRTSYYLPTWLRVITGTIGILRAVEMEHEHALIQNTHAHHCTFTICTPHTVYTESL